MSARRQDSPSLPPLTVDAEEVSLLVTTSSESPSRDMPDSLSPKDAQPRQGTTHVPAWIVSSVLSSTFLIIINKTIMRTYGFTFVYTLTCLHFLAGYIALYFSAGICCASFTPKSIGLKQNIIVAAVGVGSVATMNLSLQANSVGTYQMLKLLVIPGCMVMQRVMQGTLFPFPIVASLIVMLAGVAYATVTDILFSYPGLAWGFAGVATTTLFAVWQGSKQSEHKVDAQQLMYSIAPYQAVWAGALALAFDCTGDNNVVNHEYVVEEVLLIFLSALIAVSVNMSSMTLIGKTSAVTFQVVGHAKTCLILIAGYLMLPDHATGWAMAKNVLGVIVGLLGVFSYSYFKLTIK